jgi:hypothetical protein
MELMHNPSINSLNIKQYSIMLLSFVYKKKSEQEEVDDDILILTYI